LSALAGTCIQINKIGSDSAIGSSAIAPTKCDSRSIAIGGVEALAKGFGIAIGDQANATAHYNTLALG